MKTPYLLLRNPLTEWNMVHTRSSSFTQMVSEICKPSTGLKWCGYRHSETFHYFEIYHNTQILNIQTSRKLLHSKFQRWNYSDSWTKHLHFSSLNRLKFCSLNVYMFLHYRKQMVFDTNQPLKRRRKGVQIQVKAMCSSVCPFTHKSFTAYIWTLSTQKKHLL